MRLLLAHGANPNARAVGNPRYENGGHGGNLAGGTPFLMAARAADVRVMRFLLANGSDPLLATTTNSTPLMMAAGIGHSPGASPVRENNALEAVKLCVESGNDVNAVNAAGETALHAAAYRGPQGADTIVQFLVSKGAKVNAKNKRGWTPLVIAEGIFFQATNTQAPSTADLLRKLGADPSPPEIERDGEVKTPARQNDDDTHY
jgi:ankyrin repeat protein